MNKYLFSVKSVLILLLMLSSCISKRQITNEDMFPDQGEARSLILHTPGKTYSLNNYIFSEDFLSGDLQEKSKNKGYMLHVYTQRKFDVIVADGKSHHADIERDHIHKMVSKKFSGGNTALLAGGIGLGLFLSYYFAMSSITLN